MVSTVYWVILTFIVFITTCLIWTLTVLLVLYQPQFDFYNVATSSVKNKACTHTHTHTRTHTHTHTRTRTHTRMHTHIHTHTHTEKGLI